MKNLLVAQSGGPSAAINATLAGVVEQAMISGQVGKIYGAVNAIKGVLTGNIVEIGPELSDPSALRRLTHTPASALGSVRAKLKDPKVDPSEFEQIFRVFAQHDIGYFVYIGGNDSMDTVQKLSAYAREKGITDIQIMGAPKTIDNDLCGMDHSPGFGSAAKYIATTFSELWCDCRVYDIPAVTIVEVMGRHVGWLTAAAALASQNCGAPHLIYLPEVPFEDEKFLEDIRQKQQQSAPLLVAISEGIAYSDGSFVGESNQSTVVDAFGHKYLSGAGKVLEDLVQREIGCKVRSINLSLMQRSAGHLASANDLAESKMLGATAMLRALQGVSGQVAVLNRVSTNPYRVSYSTVPAEQIANLEKAVPREWINPQGNFVTQQMLDYLAPLVEGSFGPSFENGLPVHQKLYD